jgi:hypothetical protein
MNRAPGHIFPPGGPMKLKRDAKLVVTLFLATMLAVTPVAHAGSLASEKWRESGDLPGTGDFPTALVVVGVVLIGGLIVYKIAHKNKSEKVPESEAVPSSNPDQGAPPASADSTSAEPQGMNEEMVPSGRMLGLTSPSSGIGGNLQPILGVGRGTLAAGLSLKF